MFSKEEFELLKSEKEILYKTFGEVYCPYFKEKVLFNALGLEHLKFKKPRMARLEEDQYMRFKLLHLAPEVVSLSHTVQGIRIAKSFEEVRVNNRNEYTLKEVVYYEFVAVINNNRVRIILKQVENGNKFFWSISPVWQIDKKNKRRILHSMNIED